ncbi:MAG: hypothetical protein CMJ48_03635 [Planctomycetaceae bacterium]|nr:hypothetical protein [Planctomycetaceae bacterium]
MPHILRIDATKTALIAVLCISCSGCLLPSEGRMQVDRLAYSDIPRELDKVTLPIYRVEPPDILLIEAVNNIRQASAPLRAGDVLGIRLGNPEPLESGFDFEAGGPLSQVEVLEAQYRLDKQVRDKFLDSEFRIQPGGIVDLGPIYGSVKLEGLSLEAARAAIENHLKTYAVDQMGRPVGLKNPQVTVTLPNVAGKQEISGEHLVRPDGSISMGIYGDVRVTGLTLAEVKSAVESHLSQHIHEPEINVDVLSYNSKVIYVVTDGGGFGEQVVRLPVTGNETVLDAISQVQGLSDVSSKDLWVARPGPPGSDTAQVMDVHWHAIVAEGITTTNYQLFPGDRIYIKADKMIATDNIIGKIIAPFERIAGFAMFGHGMQREFQFGHHRGGNSRGGF